MMEPVPLLAIRRLDDHARRYIDKACREWGIFRVLSHGLETGLMQRVLRESELFFALPKEKKYYIRRTADNVWGHHDREFTGNERDWKEVFDVGPAAGKGPLAGANPLWPPNKYAFRKTLEAYIRASEDLSRRLIEAVSLSLGQPRRALVKHFRGGHASFLRLNYHPHCGRAAPAGPPTDIRSRAPGDANHHFGIGQHTDAGALTVLLQDENSRLQVRKGEHWLPVDPIPGSLVVILGDIVRVWSNDVYVAPVHRVPALRMRDQYSVAYHFNPTYETNYAPLAGEPHYEPINWGEFRARRSAHDYDGTGEDVQIAHYRRGDQGNGPEDDEADALAAKLSA